MASFEEECLKQLKAKELEPACDGLPGTPYHCQDLFEIEKKMHRQCEGVAPYFPVPTMVCMDYVNGKPVQWKYFPPGSRVRECSALGGGWDLAECFCCCSCFAYGTLVAVPEGADRAIETLAVGDRILAGWTEGAGVAPEWRPLPLTFSQGIASETQQSAVYLAFGDQDDPDDMVCSSDQPLMLADGTLTTACKLRRGDELLRLDGTAAELQTIAIGEYSGGVHHVGTGMPRDADGKPSIDGHLIGAGGLVAGDYFLQLYFGSLGTGQKVADQEERPELGTPAYAEANGEARAGVGMLFADPSEEADRKIPVKSGRFTVYSPPSSLEGPSASLLTPAQAADVLTNGTQMPISQTMPKGLVENVFKHLRGFFPNVVFYLDWLDMEPNVHAVERYGEKVVVITGGLARLVGFSYDGLLFAILAGLGRFSELSPRGVEGFAGTGTADYWAFGMPPRIIFGAFGTLELALKGLKQFKGLFALVDPAHAGGNPDDPVNEPSLACRIECVESAIGGGEVPPCAGGPEPPLIALNAVIATTDSAHVQLSMPPTAASAEDPSHYELSPAAKISSAKISDQTNIVVVLEVELEAGTEYELKIAGIESVEGTGVDPSEDSVHFRVRK